MANVLTQNPLIIDTAATITFTRPILCRRIDWVGPATVGNAAVITDLAGSVIAKGVCAVVNQDVPIWPGPAKLTLPAKLTGCNGPWQVTTINSGQLYIWF